MFDSLSPQQFESWCKVLFERVYQCRVEDMPFTGDEGRDLIIHHPDGKIIVECKHLGGAVGRPVIQKLHSAIVTEGAVKGIVATTGRFSKEARAHLAKLNVPIELLDGTQLSYLAQKSGLGAAASVVDARTAVAVPSMSDSEFVSSFGPLLLSGPRFNGGALGDPTCVTSRSTRYDGFFLATFTASGSVRTASGTESESWGGSVWCTLDGSSFGTGDPTGENRQELPLVALARALDATPGPTDAPTVQPHVAAEQMKSYLLSGLGATVSYYGRNNQRYTKVIRPSARRTQVDATRLLYVPRQTFTVRIGERVHGGRVRDDGKDIAISCPTLSSCTTCRREADLHTVLICAVCYRPAHKSSFLRPDSARCGSCGATLCRGHARRTQRGRGTRCPKCAGTAGRPLRPRWLPHALLAAFVSAASIGVEYRMPGSQALLAAAGAGIGLLPFLYVLKPGRGSGHSTWMRL